MKKKCGNPDFTTSSGKTILVLTTILDGIAGYVSVSPQLYVIQHGRSYNNARSVPIYDSCTCSDWSIRDYFVDF